MRKFGRDPTICVVEETICAKYLQTDRETDEGRRTIVLAHEMSYKIIALGGLAAL